MFKVDNSCVGPALFGWADYKRRVQQCTLGSLNNIPPVVFWAWILRGKQREFFHICSKSILINWFLTTVANLKNKRKHSWLSRPISYISSTTKIDINEYICEREREIETEKERERESDEDREIDEDNFSICVYMYLSKPFNMNRIQCKVNF